MTFYLFKKMWDFITDCLLPFIWAIFEVIICICRRRIRFYVCVVLKNQTIQPPLCFFLSVLGQSENWNSYFSFSHFLLQILIQLYAYLSLYTVSLSPSLCSCSYEWQTPAHAALTLRSILWLDGWQFLV